MTSRSGRPSTRASTCVTCCWRTGLAVILVLAITSACTSDPQHAAAPTDIDLPAELVDADWGYVGTVNDTQAFIALVIAEDEAVAYICDGEEGLAEWFRGPPTPAGELHLDNAAGLELVASLNSASASGAVTLADGTSHRFDAEKAKVGAGLFRVVGDNAEQAGISAGWIVDNDGDQRGSLRVNRGKQTAPSLPDGPLQVGGVDYPVSVFYIPGPSMGPASGRPIPYPNHDVLTDGAATTLPSTTTSRRR